MCDHMRFYYFYICLFALNVLYFVL